MDNREAIELLNSFYEMDEMYAAAQYAIQAIEELEQYRKLGTVEQVREAADRMKPKKAVEDEYDRLTCPNCTWIVYQDEYGGRSLPCCENCGQVIDWSVEE